MYRRWLALLMAVVMAASMSLGSYVQVYAEEVTSEDLAIEIEETAEDILASEETDEPDSYEESQTESVEELSEEVEETEEAVLSGETQAETEEAESEETASQVTEENTKEPAETEVSEESADEPSEAEVSEEIETEETDEFQTEEAAYDEVSGTYTDSDGNSADYTMTAYRNSSGVDGLKLHLTGNGPMPASKYGSDYESYEIADSFPWTKSDYRKNIINVSVDYQLSSISAGAFYSARSLKEVYIADSVKSIGSYAFCYTALTSLSIPSSVTSIGEFAFDGCYNLESVQLLANISFIDAYAFGHCISLKSINLPQGIKSIGRHAFDQCSSLESITIPDGVTTINDCAFMNCSGMTQITIPASVRYVGNNAFYSCKKLTIRGYIGSYIEKYAAENNIPFVAISKTPYVYTVSMKKVQDANGGLTVTWSESPYATGYVLYRSTDNTSYTKVKSFDSNTILSYTDAEANTNGQVYYYRVRAYMKYNGKTFYSAFADAVSGLYLAPPEVTGVVSSGTGMMVTWTENPKAGGYVLYRSTDKKDWSPVKSFTDHTEVSYFDSEANVNGQKYYYRVRASKKSRTAFYSYYSAAVVGFHLTAPSISKVTNELTGIQITWKKNSEATGYIVFRSTDKADWEKIKSIKSVNSLSYTDTDTLTNGQKYYYRVCAYKKPSSTAYYGSYSAAKGTCYVLATAITAMENPAAGKLIIRWSPVAGSGYEVMFSEQESFSVKEIYKITSSKVIAKAISGLEKGKTYYAKVRVYRTIGTKTYYSGWSQVKELTIAN